MGPYGSPLTPAVFPRLSGYGRGWPNPTYATFYQFPAEHWQHIRTTNPIESTFATVRLRTAKTRGCLSRTTALTMAFQLVRCAATTWRRLCGHEHLKEMLEGVQFVDGEKDTGTPPSQVIPNI